MDSDDDSTSAVDEPALKRTRFSGVRFGETAAPAHRTILRRGARINADDSSASPTGKGTRAAVAPIPLKAHRGTSRKRVTDEEEEEDDDDEKEKEIKTKITPRGRGRARSTNAKKAVEVKEDEELKARDESVKTAEKGLAFSAMVIGGVTCCALAVIVGLGYTGTLDATLGAITRADKAFGVLTDTTRQTFEALQSYQNKLIDFDKRIRNSIKNGEFVKSIKENINAAHLSQKIVR